MRIVVASLALLAAAAAAVTGCFSPSYRDGDVRCAAGTSRRPDGDYCAVTGTCWRNGHAPPRPPAPLTTATGGGVGISAPDDHRLTISVGQPLAGSGSAPGDHTVQLGVMRGAVSQ